MSWLSGWESVHKTCTESRTRWPFTCGWLVITATVPSSPPVGHRHNNPWTNFVWQTALRISPLSSSALAELLAAQGALYGTEQPEKFPLPRAGTSSGCRQGSIFGFHSCSDPRIRPPEPAYYLQRRSWTPVICPAFTTNMKVIRTSLP